MVRISNGRQTVEVTKGAFENVYKNLGFYEVGVTTAEPVHQHQQTPPTPPTQETETSNEDQDGGEENNEGEGEPLDIEALLEKPLSQWTPEELKEFVSVKGIDTTGATKVSQVRKIVKAYLDEQAKNESEQ